MKKKLFSSCGGYRYPGFLHGRAKFPVLFILGVISTLQSIGQDYSDAPATYGYPSHKINNNIYVGSVAPDNDPFPYPGTNADGDNLRKTNDENTFTSFPALTVTTATYTLSGIPVYNNTGSAAKITAWIDFDRDGIFQADEGVQSASISSSSTAGTTSLTWSNIGTTGPNITPGKTYIRVRITTDATVTTATPANAAANGEVEDYGMLITILSTTCPTPNNTISQTSLSFQNPVLQSGTALNVNAVYRFSNVTTGVDALVKIVALVGGATISVFDDVTNGVAAAFQPNITYALPAANIYAEFQITFVATGTFTSYIQFPSLTATGVDIDSDGSTTLREFQEFTNLTSYITNGATSLVAASNDGIYKRFQTTTNFGAPGISLTSIDNAASGVFKNVSSFTYRCGAVNSVAGSALPRLFSLYFDCFAYTTPTVITVNDQDFGDAPNTYGTLDVSGGAKHTNTNNLKLGFEGADAEPDGFNDGTDNNGLAKDDDMQGLSADGDEMSTNFFHGLYVNSTSYSVGVTATNLTGSAANLRAWIDFNRNGAFDIGEASTLVTVPTATENGLFMVSWPTLPAMTAGTSYIRVRLTTQSLNTNEPAGAKTDGEVEDYSLTINAGYPPVTITGSVLNDVNGVTDNLLNGTGTDAGGTLYAVLVQGGVVVANSPIQPNGIYIFGDIPTGSYTIQLSTTAGTISLSPPAVGLPAGWLNSSEAISPAYTDGTVNGVTAVTVAGSDFTSVNFGIERAPTATGSNTATQSNFAPYTQPVSATAFAGSDFDGGTVQSIRITAFPTNAQTIVINGNTYTSTAFATAFPNGATIPANTSGQPQQSLAVKPNAGASSVTIPFVTIDNAGLASTGASVTVPYYTILPVIFGNVTAQVKNCEVLLAFETLTETNNKQFEIEYGTNGNSWKTLAVIPSHGNSTALQQYSYVHTKPALAYNYYRIKQVDKNGNFIYSSVVTVRSDCAGEGSIVSYPNPVQNELLVQLPSGLTRATVKLLNATGKQVATVVVINGGTVKLSTRLLPAGIYLLQVLQDKTTIYNQKIIKE